MRRLSGTRRPSPIRLARLAAPLGLLVLLGACGSTDSNRPVSTKHGSTKKAATKSPANWGAVSEKPPEAPDRERPDPWTAP